MTDEKFILTSLDDENSKALAEVLGNKTCKKIVDYLADVKEASEQDISKALGIPINTLEYNLKKLLKSGLVEKTKNFFWSVKGRKIAMFKLAKKHIIISPKSKKPNVDLLRGILPVAIIGVILVIAGFFIFNLNFSKTPSGELKQFSSQIELEKFLESGIENGGGINVAFSESMPTATISNGKGEMDSFDMSAGESLDSQSERDYSETNIQVEGVDEADIVKTDGDYIYVVNGNSVKILNAYPAEDMSLINTLEFNESISNIFIQEDKLVIFGYRYERGTYEKCLDGESSKCLDGESSYSGEKTIVYVYDISDKEDPELEHSFEIEGSYKDSRKIGNYVYLISSKYITSNNPRPPLYLIDGVNERVVANDVYYWDYLDNNYVFTGILAINLENGESNKKVFLTGDSWNIYVSENNIYLTKQKTFDYNLYYQGMLKKVFKPILKNTNKENELNKIINSDDADYKKFVNAKILLEEYSSSLEGENQAELGEQFSELLEKFEIEIQKEYIKTIIYKIGIDKEEISYKGVGEVSGSVLNSFSMDEYNGNFRIATTSGGWSETTNNLYVLDKNLKILGSVEGLAEGEEIYSARFIGEKAYLVTFKQTDPLFVIDLENPENPEVLGYLKITGFSNYLHPYDENTLIGIGNEANENGRVLGLKITLFDVSDFENPRVIVEKQLGDRGSSTSVSWEHKSFLFDKKKGLMVIPVTLRENSLEIKNSMQKLWQGVYVFNISSKNISEIGRISHFKEYVPEYGYAEDDEIGSLRDINGQIWEKISANKWKIEEDLINELDSGDSDIYYYDYSITDEDIDRREGGMNYEGYFHDYSLQIQRSLYIENSLYTISLDRVKANALFSLDEIKEIDLNYSENNKNYYGKTLVETQPSIEL